MNRPSLPPNALIGDAMRTLVLAVLLGLGALTAPALPVPALAQAETYAMSTAELMQATALDSVFTQFGAVIEETPRQQAVPFNAAMRRAWEEASRQVFAPTRMHRRLATALDDKFSHEDYAVFAAFYASPFGIRVSEAERRATELTPAGQTAARISGGVLAIAATPRRKAQIDEMLGLVSADLSAAMVRQSMRGILIGLSMTTQQGDIEVPWEEIEAQLDAIMPGLEADIASTQKALMFYAYETFSEADLDEYLVFLRTGSAQKLYAVIAYAVGDIITERMHAFGDALATRLARVSV